MKKCIIRFDDICATMDWKQFYKAENLMDKYDIKPLIGIIPQNEDPNQMIDSYNPLFWSEMKRLEKKGWTIALHGYTHVYNKEKPKTMLCGRKHSEFAGNTLETQDKLIEMGNKILLKNEIKTNIFFAPAHTYDNNTLKALKKNGFKYLSDGYSKLTFTQYGISCVPCRSFGIPKRLAFGINTVVLHTSEWSKDTKSHYYDELVSFLEKNRCFVTRFEDVSSSTGLYCVQKSSEIIFKLARLIKNKLRIIYYKLKK